MECAAKTRAGQDGKGFGLFSALARQAVRAVVASFLAVPAFLGSEVAAAAEDRALKLYFTHTGEKATITFKRDGRFDPRGLKQINRFLRDWRRNEPARMDPRLLDLVWEVYQKAGGRDYIHVVSAYRSPATNNMLRTRSRVTGVAKNSQHMLGKAMDFYIPGVQLAKLRGIAMQMQGGGVGYYPKSGSPFVHLDVGNVRAWPRMSRQELARIFPSGKTMHLPSDGRPLPGYSQAVAEYKKRGSVRQVEIASAEDDEDTGSSATLPSKLAAALVPTPRRSVKRDIPMLSAVPVPEKPAPESYTNLASLSVPLPVLRPGSEKANAPVDPVQTASIDPVAIRPEIRPAGPSFGASALASLKPSSMPGAQSELMAALPLARSPELDGGVSSISDEALMGWALHGNGRELGMSAPRIIRRAILADHSMAYEILDDEEEADEAEFDVDRFGSDQAG
ncbi:DUF882 domain-containing protein [Rhizobium sp. Rhizsp82]|uniref:DUF882 domain-containing protein n=1 Tax=Rhizobium sp. Rhizsp82 TaxID=3243057 RepID=UPI0039B3E697